MGPDQASGARRNAVAGLGEALVGGLRSCYVVPASTLLVAAAMMPGSGRSGSAILPSSATCGSASGKILVQNGTIDTCNGSGTGQPEGSVTPGGLQLDDTEVG